MILINKCLSYCNFYKHKMLNTSRYQRTCNVRNYLCKDESFYLESSDREKIRNFLRFNLIKIFNYPFAHKYSFRRVSVHTDVSRNFLKYVYHKGKKLYFKRGLSDKDVCILYNSLCCEQDTESPHYYGFLKQVYSDGIAVDVGSAEGIWSLDLIDELQKLYLFECDEAWQEALLATFAPWNDKVQIVNKYVSEKDDKQSVSLDTFFALSNLKPTVIKIDVEGGELEVLKGAKRLLFDCCEEIDLLVCTYHRHDDEKEIECYLKQNNKFDIYKSEGYMLFYWENGGAQMDLGYHDFRRGLIHAVRKI